MSALTRLPKKVLQSVLAVLLLVNASAAYAVAYCALRDPVNTIYELFPEADSYRSSVKTVGRQARQAVIEELPFTLHFNELGRHTLYVALKDGVAIGFVHARSELGEWGITEFAWAVTPDLRVRGVKIQRSRDPIARRLAPQALTTMVQGKDLAALEQEFHQAQANNNQMLTSLSASAMKTLVITKTVWAAELAGGQPLVFARSVFGATASVDVIPVLYDDSAYQALDKVGLSDAPAFERSQVVGYRVVDSTGAYLGLVVHAPMDLELPDQSLWWAVTATGEIAGVEHPDRTASAKLFDSLLGYAPTSARDCSSLLELAALEIAMLSKCHQRS